MPPQSPKEAVAMTDSHLDYLTTKNDQLHQYKGRTQTVLSMLDTLENDADVELAADDLGETREAAATLKDQLEYWIGTTTELRDIVQTTNAVVQTVEGMTSSLTDIDEDLPERMEQMEANFEGYRDATESVNDNIEISVELLERLVLLLADGPESDEIAEISAKLTDHHQTIKDRLDIE